MVGYLTLLVMLKGLREYYVSISTAHRQIQMNSDNATNQEIILLFILIRFVKSVIEWCLVICTTVYLLAIAMTIFAGGKPL